MTHEHQNRLPEAVRSLKEVPGVKGVESLYLSS